MSASLLIAAAVGHAACSSPPAKGSPDDIGGSRYAGREHVPTSTPGQASQASATHSIKTVFVIVMENHSWSDIIGNASAPYINGTLLPLGAHATQDFDPGVHPSEPNYIWLEAGDNLAILDDDGPRANHRTTKMHLVSLLTTAGISWKSYQEGIDGTNCPIDAAGNYDPKHNPMVFFDDTTDGTTNTSPTCIAHVRPYAELADDLAQDRVAAYNFITPDLCDDMHDACAGGDAIMDGDTWLANEVPKILASKAFQTAALLITWDESENGEYPIGMIALSPFAKPGYQNALRYTHSSLLRTVQEILGVSPFVRDADSAIGLGDLFSAYP